MKRNKIKTKKTILSEVVAMVLLLASAMPAMGEVMYLTNSNKFSSGEFTVVADLNGTAGTISINLIDWPEHIIPMGFEKFSYNLSIGVSTVSENDSAWKKNVGMPNADGFGDFMSNKVKSDCTGYCHPRVESYGYGINNPLVFTLNDVFTITDLKANDQGSSLAVHLIFKDTIGDCTFCTWISDGITKCNHTLGHVVNIGEDRIIDNRESLELNLNFKDGFLKGSHSEGGCSGEDEHSGGDCMGGGSGGMGGGETGGCPQGTHPEGSCPGGSEDGSSASDGIKGIRHGQCAPHDHNINIDWGDGTVTETTSVSPLEIEHQYSDIGTYMVNVKLEDQYERVGTDSVKITAISMDTPAYPVPINTEITTSSLFPSSFDISAAEWHWGDNSISQGAVSEGSVTGSHIYGEPGLYTISLKVNNGELGGFCPTGENPEGGCPDGAPDGSGGSPGGANNGTVGTVYSSNYVVVYDPADGYVTGGGWIYSPQGAYTPDITFSGKASFGFISRYRKGAFIPTGTTEFQFKVANLNFYSDSYDWLVIAGSGAKYKGKGTINGEGDYLFMLSAYDADLNKLDNFIVDRFRIKIWEEIVGDDDIVMNNIIYDNEYGSKDNTEAVIEIGGGAIVIHK